jgi:hypothetical protein
LGRPGGACADKTDGSAVSGCRSLAAGGEAEIGGRGARMVQKRPRNERRREVILSAPRVNWWIERSAADRKAPRARRLSNSSKKICRDLLGSDET